MARLPRVLKNFNAYIDGEGYAGRVDSATLPPFAFLNEEHRAGGMDAPVDIELGMEKLAATLVVSDFDPRLWGLLGNPNIPVTLRGAIQEQGQPAESVVINMRGKWNGIEAGEWKPGAKGVQTIDVSLSYIRMRHQDVEVVEVDVVNMVRRFNGVDQLQRQREILGI